MIRAAIDKIEEMMKPRTYEIDGRTYSSSKLHRIIEPRFTLPGAVIVHTLKGFADLVECELREFPEIANDQWQIIVSNPTRAILISDCIGETGNQRFIPAAAEYLGPDLFPFGRHLPLEQFVIKVQTCFKQTKETDAMIGMLSKVASEIVETAEDDGFSQTIQLKSGLSRKSKVKVENPIMLFPHRTFQEVYQPSSLFILRMHQDPIGASLHEADDEGWKIEAIQAIGEYLKEKVNIPVIA